MEFSQNLLHEIHSEFPVLEQDIRSYSPLKLAYLGDAVYEILIRTIVMEKTGGPVKKLHKKTSALVNAKAQAEFAKCIQSELSDAELAAFRHGRNAKASSVAKNADIHDYRNATGLESLFGYLYLSGQTRRAISLLKIAFTKNKIII